MFVSFVRHAFLPAIVSLMKEGMLRGLAVTTLQRSKQLPDVMTVAESGFPGFAVDLWYGLFAPAKTPKETVSRLAAAAAAAVQEAEMKAKLVTVGFYPAAICEAEFAAYLARQYEEYGRIIGSANITAQ